MGSRHPEIALKIKKPVFNPAFLFLTNLLAHDTSGVPEFGKPKCQLL